MSDDDAQIVTRCVRCSRHLVSSHADWGKTVNLSPDMLYVGYEAAIWDDTPDERDIAFDWCSPECFAKSLFEAATLLNWRPRP